MVTRRVIEIIFHFFLDNFILFIDTCLISFWAGIGDKNKEFIMNLFYLCGCSVVACFSIALNPSVASLASFNVNDKIVSRMPDRHGWVPHYNVSRGFTKRSLSRLRRRIDGPWNWELILELLATMTMVFISNELLTGKQ